MEIKFIEAGHGRHGGNWGKFMLGRYTLDELTERPQFPGCEKEQPLVSLRGSGHEHFWVFDLATGEAARLHYGTRAYDALNEHKIWVCPLFEPFLVELFVHIRRAGSDWWVDLPRVIELPNAPFAFGGYRRPGPGATKGTGSEHDEGNRG